MAYRPGHRRSYLRAALCVTALMWAGMVGAAALIVALASPTHPIDRSASPTSQASQEPSQ